MRSWAALGAYVCGLEPLLGLCGRSWAALGTYLGGLGLLLGPLRAVLGRSWDLSWRSWAVLGHYVGGLGSLLEPMRVVSGPKNAKKMATLNVFISQARARSVASRAVLGRFGGTIG